MGEGAKRVRAGFKGSRFGPEAYLDLVESERHEEHSQWVLMPLAGFESSIGSKKDNQLAKILYVSSMYFSCSYKGWRQS